MKNQGWMRDTGRLAGMLALLPMMIGGCQSPLWGAKGTVADGQGGSQTVMPSTTVTPDPAEDPAALAAVQEFLERTRDYRQADEGSATRPAVLPEQVAQARQAPPGPTAAEHSTTMGPADRATPAEPTARVTTNSQLALADHTPAAPLPALPVVQTVRVRTAPVSAVGNSSATLPQSTSNQPLSAQAEGDVAGVERLIAQLAKKAEEQGDLEAEWRWRMAQLAFGQSFDGSAVGRGLAEEPRRVLVAALEAMTSLRAALGDPLYTGEDALARLERLRELMADRADPVVGAVALCRRVVTFGVYEEMGAEDFVAGRSVPCIVYSEIGNLRAETTPGGEYRSVVATRLELLTANGEAVWSHAEPEIVDVCRRRRQDFFIAQRITLPAVLGEGEYVLKVLVEDKLSGRAHEAVRRFQVSGPTSVAQRR